MWKIKNISKIEDIREFIIHGKTTKISGNLFFFFWQQISGNQQP